MNVLTVVEDDLDLRLLVRLKFEADPEFTLAGEASSAEEAIRVLHAGAGRVGLIVLDHSLEGTTTGLEVAPELKTICPNAKIILFTAYDSIRERAEAEPAIDAFLLKTHIERLLPLARKLVGLDQV